MRIILIMFLSLLSWNTAFAEEKSEPKVVFKKSESHKFTGLKLKGQFKKPELSYIYQRKGIRFEQIVDVPEDFNQQIKDGTQRF